MFVDKELLGIVAILYLAIMVPCRLVKALWPRSSDTLFLRRVITKHFCWEASLIGPDISMKLRDAALKPLY